MTPLERMARAICREEHILRFGEEIWRRGELDKKVNQFWQEHVPAARAALAAIEKPTPLMRDTARFACFTIRDLSDGAIDELYRAMIRAAMEEGP